MKVWVHYKNGSQDVMKLKLMLMLKLMLTDSCNSKYLIIKSTTSVTHCALQFLILR